MKPPNWRTIARAVKILGLVLGLSLLGALITDDFHQRDQAASLTRTLQSARPVTDFNTAYFVHLDCIKAYEVEFFGDIADALVAPPEGREAARVAVQADRDLLRSVVRVLCPSPTPPRFDGVGNLTAPPVVKPQTFPSETQPTG